MSEMGKEETSAFLLIDKMAYNELSVLPYTVEETRPLGLHPVQAAKVQARDLGHTTSVTRVAALIEDRQINPTKVEMKAGRIDHR